MDKRKTRRLDRIGNGPEPEPEPEEVGKWEGRDRTTKKGHCTRRGDDEYDDYAPHHPESETAAASFDSKLAIRFAFGPRYAELPPRSTG